MLTINQTIDTDLPDNGTEAIAAAVLRQTLHDMIDYDGLTLRSTSNFGANLSAAEIDAALAENGFVTPTIDSRFAICDVTTSMWIVSFDSGLSKYHFVKLTEAT